MTDIAWINPLLTSARPQAVAALLRYFRDLDTAEEAFQEACLRALKTWPRERPAARPDRLADLRRAQHRDRRGATPRRSTIRCRTSRCCPTSRTPKTRSPSGSTAPTTATTFCGCSSSAAIRTCRRRSRSRSRCASCPACRSSRSRAPSWSAKAPWSSASPAPRRRIADGRRTVRGAGRRRALRTARRGRGHGLSRLQRGLFGERRRRVACARRSATRRSGWRGCCSACSRPSPRSWG